MGFSLTTDLAESTGESLSDTLHFTTRETKVTNSLIFGIILSTKYWDDETNLGNWGRRYYYPDLGRWPSRDPIAEEGGNSLYAYVRNQPLILIDPKGEKEIQSKAQLSADWVQFRLFASYGANGRTILDLNQSEITIKASSGRNPLMQLVIEALPKGSTVTPRSQVGLPLGGRYEASIHDFLGTAWGSGPNRIFADTGAGSYRFRWMAQMRSNKRNLILFPIGDPTADMIWSDRNMEIPDKWWDIWNVNGGVISPQSSTLFWVQTAQVVDARRCPTFNIETRIHAYASEEFAEPLDVAGFRVRVNVSD